MSRHDANWAKPVRRLEASDRVGAINANVRGRRLIAANGGFGRLFQKTFSVQMGSNVTPQGVIATWKSRFGEFWPKGQKMFLPATGIAPGEVGLINASIPGPSKPFDRNAMPARVPSSRPPLRARPYRPSAMPASSALSVMS